MAQKTIAQLAQEEYEKNKKTGVSPTKDGGTVKSPTKLPNGANDVSLASGDLGAGKGNKNPSPSRTGNGNKGNKGNNSGGGGKKTTPTQADVAAAYTVPTTLNSGANEVSAKSGNLGAGKYEAPKRNAWELKNPNTGMENGGNIVSMASRSLINNAYTPYLDDEEETGTTDVTGDVAGAYSLPTGQRQGGVYISDNWNKSADEIVRDIYGNRIRWGDLQALKAAGYYDNWRAKSASMNGTPYTYGYQYAVDGGADPGSYDGSAYAAAESYSDPYAGYDAYEDSRVSAYEDYIQAAIDAIMGQQSDIDQQAADAAAQAYANYMRSRLGMPEQTSGMATGMADSMALQNDLNLQNVLAGIEADRVGAINDLRTQAAQIEAEGNLSLAELEAQLAAEAYERQMEAMQLAAQQTAAQAKAAYDEGYRTAEVLAAMEYYYGLTAEQIAASDNVSGGIGGTYVNKNTTTTTNPVDIAKKQYEDILAGAWGK